MMHPAYPSGSVLPFSSWISTARPTMGLPTEGSLRPLPRRARPPPDSASRSNPVTTGASFIGGKVAPRPASANRSGTHQKHGVSTYPPKLPVDVDMNCGFRDQPGRYRVHREARTFLTVLLNRRVCFRTERPGTFPVFGW